MYLLRYYGAINVEVYPVYGDVYFLINLWSYPIRIMLKQPVLTTCMHFTDSAGTYCWTVG